jgi:hypothetical protein
MRDDAARRSQAQLLLPADPEEWPIEASRGSACCGMSDRMEEIGFTRSFTRPRPRASSSRCATPERASAQRSFRALQHHEAATLPALRARCQ